MFKKNDYIILSIICFFLGVFLISQYFSTKTYNKVTQPENNAVLAIEVAKLTKTNSDLRREVQDLTSDLDGYRSSSLSRQEAFDQYTNDMARLDVINGAMGKTGQGVVININGNLSTPQVIDLVNAIKNIGAELLSINGQRLTLNTDISQFSNKQTYEIKVLGNSNLLKTAMERKGGIVEQITSKLIVFQINESDNVEIPAGDVLKLNYAKIIDKSK